MMYMRWFCTARVFTPPCVRVSSSRGASARVRGHVTCHRTRNTSGCRRDPSLRRVIGCTERFQPASSTSCMQEQQCKNRTMIVYCYCASLLPLRVRRLCRPGAAPARVASAFVHSTGFYFYGLLNFYYQLHVHTLSVCHRASRMRAHGAHL